MENCQLENFFAMWIQQHQCHPPTQVSGTGSRMCFNFDIYLTAPPTDVNTTIAHQRMVRLGNASPTGAQNRLQEVLDPEVATIPYASWLLRKIQQPSPRELEMKRVFGFFFRRGPSTIFHGGDGLYIVGQVHTGSVICFYPGTVFHPWDINQVHSNVSRAIDITNLVVHSASPWNSPIYWKFISFLAIWLFVHWRLQSNSRIGRAVRVGTSHQPSTTRFGQFQLYSITKTDGETRDQT